MTNPYSRLLQDPKSKQYDFEDQSKKGKWPIITLSSLAIPTVLILGFLYFKKTEIYQDFNNFHNYGIMTQTSTSITLSPKVTSGIRSCTLSLKTKNNYSLKQIIDEIAKTTKIKRGDIEGILSGIKGNDIHTKESEFKVPWGKCQ